MKKETQLVSGMLEIVSFKEFLKRVARQEYDKGREYYEYNQHQGYGNTAPWIAADDSPSDESTYVRKISYLDNAPLLSKFMTAVTFGYKYKTGVQDFWEDISVSEMMEFGEPSLLVNLGNRTWAAVTPSDFRIVFNDCGETIVNYYSKRNVGYQMLRMTEKEALASFMGRQTEMSEEVKAEVEKVLSEAEKIVEQATEFFNKKEDK